jgi:signal transduction histidine kinase
MRARDNGNVLRKWGWVPRVIALVVVGLAALTIPYGRTRNLVSECIAFAIAALTMALMTASERSPRFRARVSGLLTFATGATALTSGLASLTTSGGPFSLFSAMSTTWLGATSSLALAGSITGTAMAVVASVALAFGAPAWDVGGYPLILLLGLVFGRVLRGFRVQAEQSAALLAKAEELHKEQNRAATLDERNRIAREIHDLLAHSLGALGVQIQAAQAVLTDQADIGRAVELLAQARRMVTEGLVETRRAVHALRVDTPPLDQGLADLGAAHQGRHRAQVNLQVTGTPRSMPPDAGLALIRTAQEALVNTAKYAPGQPVEMRLDYNEGATALTVVSRLLADARAGNGGGGRNGAGGGNDAGSGNGADHKGSNGTTFETANGGYGLAGMRERLLLLDGTLSAGKDGDNWVVVARVPR